MIFKETYNRQVADWSPRLQITGSGQGKAEIL